MVSITGDKEVQWQQDKPDEPLDRLQKRTFSYLRHLILLNLNTGPQSINQISINSGINWKTVENHLIHLIGKELVKISLRTTFLKIYELTDKGRAYLDFVKMRYNKEHLDELDLGSLEPLSTLEYEFSIAYHQLRGGML